MGCTTSLRRGICAPRQCSHVIKTRRGWIEVGEVLASYKRDRVCDGLQKFEVEVEVEVEVEIEDSVSKWTAQLSAYMLG